MSHCPLKGIWDIYVPFYEKSLWINNNRTTSLSISGCICLSNQTRWKDNFEDVRLPLKIKFCPSYWRCWKHNENCRNKLFCLKSRINVLLKYKTWKLNDELFFSNYSCRTCWKVTQLMVCYLCMFSVKLSETVTITLQAQSSPTGDTRKSWSILRASLMA